MGEAVRPAYLKIIRDGAESYVPGWIRVEQGTNADPALDRLRKDPSLSYDYFVFAVPSADPLHPEQSSVVVFSSDSSQFEAGDKSAAFKLLISNESGTLAEVPAARLAGFVDHRWPGGGKKVEVQISNAEGRALTPNEARLVSSLKEMITDRLGSVPPGIAAIQQTIRETTAEFTELCWRLDQMKIEPVPPASPGEKPFIRIQLKVSSAPERIDLEALPTAVRTEAADWLTREMQAVFEEHPAVVSGRMGDIEGSGDWRLAMRRQGNTFFWTYPPHLPRHEGPISEKLSGLVAGKSPKTVPSPSAGTAMPLPVPLFERFLKWLSERLETESGLYEVKWEPQGGSVRVSAVRKPRPQFVLDDETVAAMKDAAGDLSDLVALLKKGTTDWSARQMREFNETLSKRFRDHGFELLLDYPASLEPLPDGRLRIQPFHIPLIPPERIIFTGDLDLPGIGGQAALKKILGDSPMTRQEVGERLKAIEEHYHKNGFILVGENPIRREGNHLDILFRPDRESFEVPIRVVRAGRLTINGAMTRQSLDALTAAIRPEEGKPLNTADLTRDTRVAMTRLGVKEGGNPVFLQKPDGTMEIVLNATRPPATWTIGAGANGEGALGLLSFKFPHYLPGLSQAGIDLQGGPNRFGSQVAVKTLPFTEGGIYSSGTLGYLMSDYLYRYDDQTVAEAGRTHRVGGSFLVHVPIGKGLASPLEFRTGMNGSVAIRDGRTADGTVIDTTTYSVGETTGLGAIYDSALIPGDLLQPDLSVGLNHNLTTATGDVTVRAIVDYSIPLGRYFALEATLSAAQRWAAYGGGLPPERLFGPADIPRVDFGRSLFDPYADDSYWHSGLFWVLTHNEYIQPMIGVTVSSNGRGGAQGGGGLAVRVPMMGGLVVYVGVNHEGRATWGLGAAGRWEF